MKKLWKWCIVLAALLLLCVLCVTGAKKFYVTVPLLPPDAANIDIGMLRIKQAGSNAEIQITEIDEEAVLQYLKTCRMRRTGFTKNSHEGIFFSLFFECGDRHYCIMLGGCNYCEILGGKFSYEIVNPKEFTDTIIRIVDPEGKLRLEVPAEYIHTS